MRIQVIDNQSRDLISIVSGALGRSEDVRIAVAFVSRRGVAMIEDPLTKALNSGCVVEFLVGLDFLWTEPEALRAIHDFSREGRNLSLYCLISPTAGAIYHPKLYLFKAGKDVSCVVGSSNLTEGGLRENLEVNLLMESDLTDEVVSDIYSSYNGVKFALRRVAPDEEFLSLYSELCSEEKAAASRRMRHSPRKKALLERFHEKSRSLPPPKAKRRDLIGWLELVYDNLPDGEFTNEEIYRYKDFFQRYYPNNRNVEAKIRQQLQELTKMGFVEHLATGLWRKV